MEKLKINFIDFWSGFNPTTDPIFGNFLNKHYNIIYNSPSPDIIIFSVFGSAHKKYGIKRMKKIFYSPENFILHKYPALDWQLGWNNVKKYSNYSITSFNTPNDPTNFRMPSYVRRYGFEIKDKIDNNTPKIIKSKNIVYIQSACVPFRDKMVKKLMNNFKIDCVGKCLKNTKVNVKDKLSFIKDYKIIISFENSKTSGYSTEKIIDPFIVNSIPLYWGDEKINLDYNDDSFINSHAYNEQSLIGKIKSVLTDEKTFLNMVNTKKIKNDSLFNEDLFLNFFKKAIK